MEPEARYTLVGIAVLILIGLIVAAVLWLRSTAEGRDVRDYKIYFERQSLEGLEIRGEVRMRGIRVGSVTGFLFSPRRRGAVEVLIRVEASTPVRESTEAIVARHLVTGIASIRLVNSTEESPLLTQAPTDEPYPVIAEGESAIQQFSESVNQPAVRRTKNPAAIGAMRDDVARLAERADRLLASGDVEIRATAQALRAAPDSLAATPGRLRDPRQG